ncbi:RipA family octameric membrane protein [Methanocella sp. MCL-LM]|uniref:RipA family octameric membrane protein n=1 Tax=Methanocella sp. MCL-LM TaxID=3412035 RepID=UPI003C76B496
MLEQYKLYVEMADKISERRSQTNIFYVTLLSAILAVLSVIFEKDQISSFYALILLLISLLGLLLCLIWYYNITSYSQLNSGKFKVIHEMEQQLPFPCYAREWDVLKKGKDKKKYFPLTHVEGWIPFILSVPYLILLVYTLLLILPQI